MKAIKLWLLVIMLSVTSIANAQFYGDKRVHYYMPAGGNVKHATLCVVLFEGNIAYIQTGCGGDYVREQIKKGTIENYAKNGGTYSNRAYIKTAYDPDWSTPVRTTYARGAFRYAFKKDKSEFRIFCVDKYGEVHPPKYDREFWEEVPEAELKPKTPSKDFLYE